MTPSAATSEPTLEAPRGSLVGKVLSERYCIESLLGEGGMGAVYRAEHVLMRKRLAIKVLHPEMTRMPEVVARFEREAMAAAHIEHPNVAAATDFGKLEDGSFFLVLEYVEGTNLRDVVGRGPMAPDRVMHVLDQIASALERAHALGIVHRDLKPENIMLVERGSDADFVKVLDFGIAKVPVGEFAKSGAKATTGQTLTQLGMVYGTPEYMAPEQALGQEVDARADLYALGVMAFEMLAGVRPFDAESKVALLGIKVTQDPPSIAAKNPDVVVVRDLDAIVSKLLSRDAAARFQSAREVLDALARVQLGEAKTVPPEVALAEARLAGRRLLPLVSPANLVRVQTLPTDEAPPATAEILVPKWGLVALVRRVSSGAIARVGRPVRRLTERVPWLRRLSQSLPAPALAFLFGAFFVGGVAAIVSALRGPHRVAVSMVPGPSSVPEISTRASRLAPADTTASSEVLAAAVQAGPSALAELGLKFPRDPAVFRSLFRSYAAQHRYSEAMAILEKLIALGDKNLDDDDVHDTVLAAVQSPQDGADAAFSVLEGALGSRGADWLYEISMSKSLGPRLAARARQSLAKPDIRAHATSALGVALDLRSAKTCEAKRALLPRAKEQGDPRTLVLLRPLAERGGCGFLSLADCWPCLRRDTMLVATIGVLEDRKDAKP